MRKAGFIVCAAACLITGSTALSAPSAAGPVAKTRTATGIKHVHHRVGLHHTKPHDAAPAGHGTPAKVAPKIVHSIKGHPLTVAPSRTNN